jgi:hypothetical protein
MSRNQRLALIGVAVVIVIVAFLALRPGSDDDDQGPAASAPTTTATTTTTTTTTTTEPGDDGTATTDTQPAPAPVFETITVVDGKPQGGIQKVSYEKGDQVRLRVRSDTADEIHIHGYDLAKDVEAGGQVRFSFPASIEGRFEIELENAGVQIATLEVSPS